MAKDIWKFIPDDEVRHVWWCDTDGCEGEAVEVRVDPSSYAEVGEPVCEHCDDDLCYQYTEIKT